MSDGFLARWSRLKDEARRQRPDAAEAPERVPPQEIAPQEIALTADEIAALPRIDELTAGSDVTMFLRRGVPAALRNAALRRMWMLDPAIRDFVGHARDYDYDWNTPGGAPGHGALGPDEDVAAMVRRVLGAPSETEAKIADAGNAERHGAPPDKNSSGDDHA
jgi:hypothetical protein